MSDWSIVSCVVDPEEETGNFGCSSEQTVFVSAFSKNTFLSGLQNVATPSLLYDISTLGTISASSSSMASPDPVVSASSNGSGSFLSVAVDALVHIFHSQENETTHFATFDAGATVDLLIWSCVADFLMVCGRDGSINVFHVASKKILYKRSLQRALIGSQPCFVGGQSFTTPDGLDALIVVSRDSMLYEFSGFNFVKLHDVILSCNVEAAEGIKGGIIFTETAMKVDSKRLQCAVYSDVSEVGFSQLVLLDATALYAYSTAENRLVQRLPIPNLKKIVRADETSFVAVDVEGNLFLICAISFLLLSRSTGVRVTDITVLKPENEGDSPVLMTTSLVERNIALLALPDFTPLFKMKLSGPGYLVDMADSHECILLVEGLKLEDAQSVGCLRVRALSEAHPEARLKRLVNRRKFREALMFANLFKIPAAEIYEAHVKDLVEQLSFWNASYQNSEDKRRNDWSELIKCLASIDNDEFLVELAEKAALPTVEMMLNLFDRILEKVQGKGNTVAVGDILKKRRLLITCVKVLGDKALETWYNRSVSVLDIVKHLLEANRIPNAVYVWLAHRPEIHELLDEDTFQDLLAAVSPFTESLDMLPFFSRLCLDVKDAHEHLLPQFVEWIGDYVANLEAKEYRTWPSNAEALLKTLVSHFDDDHGASVDVDLLLRTLTSIEDLGYLKKQYGVKVPYSLYSQDEKCDVFSLLCHNLQPEEIPGLVNNFIRGRYPDTDKLLFDVAQKLIDETVSVRSWEDTSSWEELVVIVLPLIESVERRLDLIILSLDAADVPWSPTIQSLAKKGLEYNHPKIEIVKDKEILAQCKTLLKKHGVETDKATNRGETTYVIRSVLAGGHKDAYQDALKVAAFFGDVDAVDVSWWSILHHLKRGKTEEAIREWSQSSDSVKYNSARKWILTLDALFGMRARMEKPGLTAEMNAFASGLSTLLKYFASRDDADVLDTLSRLISMFLLHKKHGVIICADEFYNKDCCKLALSAFCRNRLADQTDVDHLAESAIAVGQLLQLNRAEALSVLVLQAIDANSVQAVVGVSRYLLDCVSLFDSAYDVRQLLRRLTHLFSPDPAVKELPGIAYKLACEAATLCSDAMSQEMAQLCRWYRLGSIISNKFGGGDASVGWSSKDPYQNWNLGLPMYQDLDIPLGMTDPFSPLKECLKALLSDCNDESCYSYKSCLAVSIVADQQNSDLLEAQEQDSLVVLDHLSKPATELVTALSAHQQYELALSALTTVTVETHPFLSCVAENLAEPARDKGTSATQAVALQLAQRILLPKIPDYLFALGVSSLTEQSKFVNLLENTMKRSQNDPSKLRSVAQIAFKLSDELEVETYRRLCVENLKCAEWACRLLEKKIPCTVPGLRTGDTSAVVRSLAVRGDLNLLREFCTAFGMDVSELLLSHLTEIITSFNPTTLEEIFEKWPSVEESLKRLIRFLPAQHNLVAVLLKELHQVSDYNYEVLRFVWQVLEERKDLFDERSPIKPEQALKLLRFLGNYSRISPPTQMEREKWYRDLTGLSTMPPLSNTRLPFTLLVSPAERKKVLTPELSLKTWQPWVEASSLISMDPDEIAFLAGKNAVSLLAKCQSPDELADVLASFKHCVDSIKDADLLLGCVNWARNELPKGRAKLAMAEYAMESEARIRGANVGDPRAKQRFETVITHYRLLATEDVLERCGYLTPETLPLCGDPTRLFSALFESWNPRDAKAAKSHRLGLNDAVNQVCHLYDLDPVEIRFGLIDDWLSSLRAESSDLDETTVDWQVVDHKKPDSQTKRSSVASILYLISNESTETYLDHLYNYVVSQDVVHDSQFKLCSLDVLLLANDNGALKNIGTSKEELRSLKRSLTHAARLEKLRLPIPVTIFESCDKFALIQRLTVGTPNSDFIRLALDLAKDYLPTDLAAWKTILEKSVQCKDVTLLEDSLTFISMVPQLWASSSVLDAWQQFLQLVLKTASSTQWSIEEETRVARSLGLVLQCPDLSKINFEELAQVALLCPEPALALVVLPFVASDVSDRVVKTLLNGQGQDYIDGKKKFYSCLGLSL